MNNSDKIKKNSKLNKYVDIECHECGKLIEGKWDSQVYLGMETGELDKSGIHRWLIYDKHIKCSPSRAQRIVHPKFPRVIDARQQFDWRPEADNTWTDEMRVKYKKLYTDSWVSLQKKYNPSWI
jgi:hypothetical protein|tara:strand:- start:107 stop:478 length:372 start_codon:yes stop_codon:yes gene_type:complete